MTVILKTENLHDDTERVSQVHQPHLRNMFCITLLHFVEMVTPL